MTAEAHDARIADAVFGRQATSDFSMRSIQNGVRIES